jgi:hypothetical protein
MALVRRRAFLLLALALPLAATDESLAASRDIPDRMKPLGTWKLVTPRIVGANGDTVTADLLFRPMIDVERPTFRHWIPRWDPVDSRSIVRCPPIPGKPVSPPNGTVLPSMIAGVQTPVAFDVVYPPAPPRPNNVYNGEKRSIELAARQQNPRYRTYQAMVELADPASCRRALYGFKILFQDNYPT